MICRSKKSYAKLTKLTFWMNQNSCQTSGMAKNSHEFVYLNVHLMYLSMWNLLSFLIAEKIAWCSMHKSIDEHHKRRK